MSYKSLAWSITIVPTTLLAGLLFLNPKILSGGRDYDAPLVLSLVGVVLSYYGFVFSSYAAMQVQAISDVYFFKIRSPDLQKKLSQISKSVSEFGAESADNLRSQKFISEASVAFRSAKRIKNKHVKKVAGQAEATLKDLRESMKLYYGPGKSAGQVEYYWEFHQKIAELVDELNEQIKDVRAYA